MVTSVSNRRPSAIDALGEGISHMRQKLFPFSFSGWITLGFVSLLESCGSGSGTGTAPNPLRPGGTRGSFEDPIRAVEGAFAWIAVHMVLFVSVLMGILLLSLLIMWLRSRTVFVYIDDVASGRFDLVRPWGEHGARADSFFVLSLVVQGAAFVLMVLILGLGGYFVLWTRTSGWPVGAIALGVIPIAFIFILSLLLAGLLNMALRDFVAPLQISRNVGAQEAAGIFASMLAATPGLLIGYAILKFVVGIAVGLVVLIGSCLTCCIGALPLVNQTLFQPIYYAERAWSLKLLAQMGEDVFAKLGPPGYAQAAYPDEGDAPTEPIDLSQIDWEKPPQS